MGIRRTDRPFSVPGLHGLSGWPWCGAGDDRYRRARRSGSVVVAAEGCRPWRRARAASVAAHSLRTAGGRARCRAGREAGGEPRSAGVVAACVRFVPVISAACWFLSFYLIYGTFNPAAPYGGYTQSRLANVSRGLTGLLIDQQFGVLPNAPIYLAGLAGLWLFARTHRRLSIELAAVVAPYAIAVACYQMWWGGHSSPGRFIVPILLAFGLPCAVLWQRLTGPLVRALLAALLAGSIGLALRARVVDTRSAGLQLPRWRVAMARGSQPDRDPAGGASVPLQRLGRRCVDHRRGVAAGSRDGHDDRRGRDSSLRFGPGTIRAVVAPAVVVAILTLGPGAGWTVARAQAIDVGNGLWRVVRGLSHGSPRRSDAAARLDRWIRRSPRTADPRSAAWRTGSRAADASRRGHSPRRLPARWRVRSAREWLRRDCSSDVARGPCSTQHSEKLRPRPCSSSTCRLAPESSRSLWTRRRSATPGGCSFGPFRSGTARCHSLDSAGPMATCVPGLWTRPRRSRTRDSGRRGRAHRRSCCQRTPSTTSH